MMSSGIHARTASPSSLAGPVVVYEWGTWAPDFLIFSLFPHAARIAALPAQSVEEVMTVLPAMATRFVFHLNCTITGRFPTSRAQLIPALAARGIAAVNAEANDISKRTIQRCCLDSGLASALAGPDGPADESLIVKTNFNYGGYSERRLSDPERRLLDLPDPSDFMKTTQDYKVLPRREVDPSWWENPSLTVERFIENRDGRCYRAYCLLHHVALCELVSQKRIKKMAGNTIRRVWMFTAGNGGVDGAGPDDYPSPVVQALLRFRQSFPLDFGTIDVMEDAMGLAYVVDVNTTPYYGVPVPGLVEHLQRAVL